MAASETQALSLSLSLSYVEPTMCASKGTPICIIGSFKPLGEKNKRAKHIGLQNNAPALALTLQPCGRLCQKYPLDKQHGLLGFPG